MNDAQDDAPRIRAHGIGGSDIAAIMGMHPYSDALDVWAEKTGQSVEGDKDSPDIRRGMALEDLAIREYWAAQPRDGGLATKETLRHPVYPFLHGEADGIILPADENSGPPIILEVKVPRSYTRRRWLSEGVPDYVAMQAMWYMGLMLLNWCDTYNVPLEQYDVNGTSPAKAVVIVFDPDGWRFDTCDVWFDVATFRTMEGFAVGWWRTHVEAGEVPTLPEARPEQGSVAMSKGAKPVALAADHPEAAELNNLAGAYDRAKALQREADTTVEELRAALTEKLEALSLANGGAQTFVTDMAKVTLSRRVSGAKLDTKAMVGAALDAKKVSAMVVSGTTLSQDKFAAKLLEDAKLDPADFQKPGSPYTALTVKLLNQPSPEGE